MNVVFVCCKTLPVAVGGIVAINIATEKLRHCVIQYLKGLKVIMCLFVCFCANYKSRVLKKIRHKIVTSKVMMCAFKASELVCLVGSRFLLSLSSLSSSSSSSSRGVKVTAERICEGQQLRKAFISTAYQHIMYHL